MGDNGERRRSKRTDAGLPVELPGGVPARALNMSAKGAYCVVDHEIPAFTKLDLVIHVPVRPSEPPITVACSGVVVRYDLVTDEAGREQHCTAIYFEWTSSRARQVLEAFVGQ